MNFSKSSLLSIFALLLTLAVCYAKDAESASKPEVAVAPSDDHAEGIKNDKPDGASTEAGTSDFDIEQLLNLINALKNQDFDEVDKALKDGKMGDDAARAEKKAADKKRFNEDLEEDKDLDTSASSTDFEEKEEL